VFYTNLDDVAVAAGAPSFPVLEPLDLMARLAAPVPPPRMHFTRFHGCSPRTASCARR
jgi:hypothetical protein